MIHRGATNLPDIWPRKKIDELAEHMAEGLSEKQISEAMRVSPARVHRQITRLRRSMGPQAI